MSLRIVYWSSFQPVEVKVNVSFYDMMKKTEVITVGKKGVIVFVQ